MDESLPEELITPEMIEIFVSETNDLLDRTENNLLEVEKNPLEISQIDEAFRSIHTVKGNAGFFGFAEIEKLCMEVESKMDTVRKRSRKADHSIVTDLLGDLDGLHNLLGEVAAGKQGKKAPTEEKHEPTQKTETGEEPEAPPEPAGEAEGEGTGDTAPGPPAPHAGGAPWRGKTPETREEVQSYLGDILVEMGAVSADQVEEALERQEKKLGEILLEEGVASREAVEKVLTLQAEARSKVEAKGEQYKIKRKDIRVDMDRLDRLFDLMGELITAESMVLSNPELEELEIENFQRASDNMTKITREMQEITMSIRMIPLEGLFNKMRRLVSDLAKKFDKQIQLTISGEETEMDRNVIEQISDPLVHIIRNAIDHGVEPAGVRKERGKDPRGHIRLDARYEGNEIWITVQDDGGGLNRERILDKARRNNLVGPEAAEMDDEEVFKLVFEPGFSTAEQVSEISGRGVGMDVVKRNIEKLRGKIGIESTEGEGTAFILKIPLTMAIIESIYFRVGEMGFCLPLEDIVEFQKVESAQVTRTEGRRCVLKLRDEILPVLELYRFFDVSGAKQDVEKCIFIIAQTGGRKAALMVDEILDNRQVVIKPLPEYIGKMRSVSGCSIMGDGEIGLIIDTSSLLKEELD